MTENREHPGHTRQQWQWQPLELEHIPSGMEYAQHHMTELCDPSADDSVLCHMADWPILPEHKALIAAAPKMLEALTRIIDRAESGDEADHFSETFDGDFEFARRAIAKATT